MFPKVCLRCGRHLVIGHSIQWSGLPRVHGRALCSLLVPARNFALTVYHFVCFKDYDCEGGAVLVDICADCSVIVHGSVLLLQFVLLWQFYIHIISLDEFGL